MNNTVPYTDMKDSGIKWTGSVPASWNVRTLYQLATRVNNKNSDLSEQNLLSLSYGKIKRKDINTNDGLLPASFDGYNIIEAGDIVLRLTDLQNDHTSLRVGHATERGIITSAYTTLRLINPAHSRYLYYLIHAFDLKKGFYGMGSGVRQGLNYDEVKELRVVIPSQKEQDAITSYLDKVCQQIDLMIDEAKASIDEYKKWRSATIYEAVTKGINSSVDLQPCELDAVDAIPAHWETRAIKYLASCNDEVLPENTDDTFAFNYIDIGSVKYGDGITQLQPMIFSEAPSRARRIVQENDVIISTVRTYLKAVAIISKFEAPQIVSTGFAVLRAYDVNPDFLYYAVLSDNFICKVEASSVGMSYPAINASEIMAFKIPLPPKEEQTQIAVYLNQKCGYIGQLVSEKNDLIDELESFKRALIYETVTGKRKVV